MKSCNTKKGTKSVTKPKPTKKPTKRVAHQRQRTLSRVSNEQILAKLNELMDLAAKALASNISSAIREDRKNTSRAINGSAAKIDLDDNVLFHSA